MKKTKSKRLKGFLKIIGKKRNEGPRGLRIGKRWKERLKQKLNFSKNDLKEEELGCQFFNGKETNKKILSNKSRLQQAHNSWLVDKPSIASQIEGQHPLPSLPQPKKIHPSQKSECGFSNLFFGMIIGGF